MLRTQFLLVTSDDQFLEIANWIPEILNPKKARQKWYGLTEYFPFYEGHGKMGTGWRPYFTASTLINDMHHHQMKWFFFVILVDTQCSCYYCVVRVKSFYIYLRAVKYWNDIVSFSFHMTADLLVFSRIHWTMAIWFVCSIFSCFTYAFFISFMFHLYLSASKSIFKT